MGLTRPRAHQVQDLDYKQTARAVTTSNITLSGGAPATVDGVSLALRDRILVTGQSTGSENGIYYVTTVGAGSNGTWVRSLDADATGEVSAGMIIMVTEGTTYADTQWKLTTDDPITIGTTSLTFVRNGNAAYGTFAVSGEDSIVADTIGDTLTIVAGTNLALTTNASTDTLTITPSLTPSLTSLTATGNVSAGNVDGTRANFTNLVGTLETASQTNITSVGTLGSLTVTGNVSAGNLSGTNITGTLATASQTNITSVGTLGSLAVTGNVTGGNISTAGIVTGGSVTDGTATISSGAITGATTATFTNTSTGDTLLLTTTEDSSSAAPVITLKRNSASPADADYLGQIKFKGENDADQEVVYGKITGKIQDASDGTEDGLLEFANMKAGSNNINMRLRSDSLQLLNGTNFQIREQQDLRFYDSDSSNYIGLKAPATVGSDVDYVLPADGTSGQVLQTDGSGTLSFTTISSGSAANQFPNCTVSPLPGSEGNFDLAKQYDQSGSVESPFEAISTDAFGVSLGEIYTMMDPVGSTITTDLGSVA